MKEAINGANPFLDRRVQEQIKRATARSVPGDDFDGDVLAITLLLHRVMAMLSRTSALDLEPLKVTSAQFNVLTVLHRSEAPISMSQLSASLSSHPPNVTGLVASLSRRGLVSTSIAKNDHRSKVVALTDEGTATMEAFLPGHWRYQREFYAGLNSEGRAHLARLLDQLLVSLYDDDDIAEPAASIVKAARED